MTEEKTSRRGRRNHGNHANTVVILLAIIICLAVTGGAGYLLYVQGNQVSKLQYPQLEPEGNVRSGTLSNPEDRQAELDAIVREGMLSFSINATPVMKSGKDKANLLIENPASNGNRFTVCIEREDTGEKIYQSGYLDPEQYIEDAPLDVELPAGEYACVASFDAYRISDNAYIGRGQARITLYVQS